MKLTDAAELKPYLIKSINTNNEEVKNFLSSLGFVPGETVEIILKQRSGVVVLIKDARYSLDTKIAAAISI